MLHHHGSGQLGLLGSQFWCPVVLEVPGRSEAVGISPGSRTLAFTKPFYVPCTLWGPGSG